MGPQRRFPVPAQKTDQTRVRSSTGLASGDRTFAAVPGRWQTKAIVTTTSTGIANVWFESPCIPMSFQEYQSQRDSQNGTQKGGMGGVSKSRLLLCPSFPFESLFSVCVLHGITLHHLRTATAGKDGDASTTRCSRTIINNAKG